MPSPFDNLTDEDYASAASQMPNAPAIAAFGTKGNPAQAAEAVKLSGATGTPAPVINQDVDKFKEQINAQAAGALVNSNPQLRQYATSDPMKAEVSGQDWHNLDGYSQAAGQVPKQSFWQSWIDKGSPTQQAIAQVGQAFTQKPEGTDELQKYLDERIPQGMRWAVTPEDLTGMAATAYQVGAGALTLGGTALGLGIDTVADAASRHLGISGDALKHELEGMAESEFGRSAIHMEPYFKSGKSPGREVSPVLEGIRKKESTDAVAKISDAFSEAQKAETKALVPEYFKDFAEQHHGDQAVGISPEVLEKLYGDREPTPDDGILGFVPGVAEQMEVAKATGADIRVPVADLMAHMDPEVFREVKESIRPFDDGYTALEDPRVAPTEADARYPDPGIGQVHMGFSNVRTPDLVKDTGTRGSFDVPDWYPGLKSTIDGLAEQLGLPITPQLWVGDHPNAGKLGYASSDGHIVLHSGQAESTAVATALHELGHQVDFQRFKWLAPEEKAAVLAAHERDAAKAGGQTTHQWRPISFAGVDDVPIGHLKGDYKKYLTSFSEWFAEQTQRWITKTEEPKNFVERFFQGIAQAWQKIYDTVRGHQEVAPSMDDFLHGLWGSKRAPLPISARNEPVHFRVFDDPAAIGMTKGHWDRYQKLMDDKFQAEYEAGLKHAAADEKRRLAPEWAAKREVIRQKVQEDFKEIPRFAADKAIRNGDVPRIASDALTDEEKAILPKSYYEKNGMQPDNLAARLGYQSGRGLIDDLTDFHRNRGKMQPDEYIRQITNKEVERRMEQEHGRLDDVAMQAARDSVTKDSGLSVMHAELEAMAAEHGFAAPFSRDQIELASRDKISKMPMGVISSDGLLRGIERINKQIEDALLKGKPEAAFAERQRKYIATVIAKEAQRIEKIQAKTMKILKKYDEREGHPQTQEYTDAMHSLMAKIGEKIPRTLGDITENMKKNGYDGLADFAEQKMKDYRDIFLPDFLKDPNWHESIKAMTARDFEDVADTIKSIDFHEKDERKLLVGQEKQDYAEVQGKMIDQVKTMGPAGPWEGHMPNKGLMKMIKALGWGLIQIEAIAKRIDRGNSNGLFTQAIARPVIAAANHRDRLWMKIQEKLFDVEKIPNVNEKVPNTLFRVAGQPLEFTRRNLLGILQHMGNADNFARLTEGWKVEPEAVKQWVAKHTTPEDWKRAQAYGDIFNWLFHGDGTKEFGGADAMSHATTGVGIRRLDLGVVDNPHGLKLDGWYNPASYYSDLPGSPKIERESVPIQVVPEGIIGGDYYRANTNQGYTKRRTTSTNVGPVELSLDSVPMRMKQMAHDIAMRQTVMQLNKLFHDKEFMFAMRTHFSPTATDMLLPYLNDMAGASKVNSPVMARTNAFFAQFLRNTAMAQIGFKLSTAAKHGTTALTNSIFQEGGGFGQAAATLWTDSPAKGKNWMQFAMQESDELGRRVRGPVATAALDHGLIVPGAEVGLTQKITALRDATSRAGTSLIAGLDLGSAVPTWVSRYKKEMALNPGDHGAAVSNADAAVREAHGSSSYASKPDLLRSHNPFTQGLTQFYGFFNEMLQKQYEMMWRAKDAYGYAVTDGDFKHAFKEINQSSLIFARLLMAGTIEEYFSGEGDPREGLGHKALRTLGYTFSATLPFVRDIAHGIISGHHTEISGMFGIGPQSYIDIGKQAFTDKPHNKLWAKKLMNDVTMATATTFGVPLPGAAHAMEFAHGLATGQEHPKSVADFVRGASRGTVEKK